jgi:hypothetical protein
MFVLVIKMFDERMPIGCYESKEAASNAADDLNKENRKACYFYVQEVPVNSYDLSQVL